MHLGAQALLVGGGGGGSAAAGGRYDPVGGAGGGDRGGPGRDGPDGTGGHGGTQTAPGAGGAGEWASGHPGTGPNGGTGASAPEFGETGGGGGGGGWFGGGGGGAGFSGAGGGGGSGYAAPGLSATLTPGVRAGHGSVTILFEAPANTAPEAVDDAHTTNEDTPLEVAAPGVLGNDSDADGDALAAVLVTPPAHGTVALARDGSFVYTPDADFHGADRFSYEADDGALRSGVATVVLTVGSVNDPPTAAPDAYAVDQGTTLAVAAPGVLADDADPDGDALGAQLWSGPAHGTLSLDPDGGFTYTPDPGFHGPDSFEYLAADGQGAVAGPTTVELTVRLVYRFSGFASPVRRDAVNVVRAGQTIPIRYRLTDPAGEPITDPASFQGLTSQQGGTGCGPSTGPVAIEGPPGDSGLEHLGDGEWRIGWKTPKEHAGQCRTLSLRLQDGSTHTAAFLLR